MFFEGINIIPVVIAAIFSMALGFVWYSPYLFGKQWLSLMAERAAKLKAANTPKSKMIQIYAYAFVSTVVSAYVLAIIFNSIFAVGFMSIIVVGLVLWIGFMLPVLLNNYLYGGEPLGLLMINSGYQLVSMLLMSLIIGIFG